MGLTERQLENERIAAVFGRCVSEIEAQSLRYHADEHGEAQYHSAWAAGAPEWLDGINRHGLEWLTLFYTCCSYGVDAPPAIVIDDELWILEGTYASSGEVECPWCGSGTGNEHERATCELCEGDGLIYLGPCGEAVYWRFEPDNAWEILALRDDCERLRAERDELRSTCDQLRASRDSFRDGYQTLRAEQRKRADDGQHNGYKNFETFAVVTVLDNDEPLYNTAHALAKRVASLPTASERADEFETWIGEIWDPAIMGMISMHRVDWREVAEHFAPDPCDLPVPVDPNL